VENFVSELPSSHYAKLYAEHDLCGGHVIMLGPNNDVAAAEALAAFPNGLMIGGGVTAANAASWLERGASHVIATSYFVVDGRISHERLKTLSAVVSRRRLVIDLSARRHPDRPDGDFLIVYDKWQTFTDTALTAETLTALSSYCAEFLVHAVDVEGKQSGIQVELVSVLANSPIPVTYAGGVRSLDDVTTVHAVGRGRVHVSIGTALDIFGGKLNLQRVIQHVATLNARAAEQVSSP